MVGRQCHNVGLIWQVENSPPQTSLRLHVIAKKHIVVAQIEAAAGDDRVGPGRPLAAVGLLEARLLLVAGGTGLDESDLVALLATHVEVAVGCGHRAFAHGAGLSLALTRLEIDAGELVARCAVAMLVHGRWPAM